MLARLNLARNRLGMKKKNQPFIFQKGFLAKEKLGPQLPTSATHRWDYGKEDVHSLQQRNTLRHLRHPHEHQLEFAAEQLFQCMGKGIAD